MTASAEIEVSRRDDVLRVPNAALRYKPADGEASASAAVPARGAGMAADLSRIAAGLKLDSTQQAAFDTALEAMRQRAAARTAPAAKADANGGGSMFGGPRRGNANTGNGNGGAMRQRAQERLRQQFDGFRATLSEPQRMAWDTELAALAGARRVTVYSLGGGTSLAATPEPVTVRVGASDGSWTEVSGPVEAGDVLVVGAERPIE